MPTSAECEGTTAAEGNDTPIFALIIGNETYNASKSFKSAPYAVNDADAIEHFLSEHFLSKSETLRPCKIISRRNATRKQMLDGFQELEDATKEVKDPCMVIFYAGHGDQVVRPKEWEEYTTDCGMIEILCPSDIGAIGEDGKVVEGIPDRFIGAMLNNLARKRGNNITVILDCCHSASMDRDEEAEELAPRCLENSPPITAAANIIPRMVAAPGSPDDSDATRGVRIAPGFGSHSGTSHVLLAACGRDKSAYPNHAAKHGYFTSAVLKFLLNRKDLKSETYLTLISALDMPKWQVPHCIGDNRSRPLFNACTRELDPSYMLCKRTTVSNEVKYTLGAGLAEGIVPNESLHLYKAAPYVGQVNSSPPFGTMIATRVDAISTVLHPYPGRTERIKIPSVFYAKKIIWPNPSALIYCKDKEFIASLSGLTRASIAVQGGIVRAADLVDDPSKAAIILTVEGDKVYMDRNDAVINQYTPQRFHYTLSRNEPTSIQRIISGWRHFDYHLNRGRGEPDAFTQIRLELHWLEPTNGKWDDAEAEYRPFGENLLKEGVLVHQVVVSDEQTERPLGFTLHNDGDTDVFPHLFWFDPVELTILPWALVAAGQGLVDAPLRRHSRLAVGYGNGGANPVFLNFEDGSTQEFGFFKLFITSFPTTLHSIRQVYSPFMLAGRTDEDDEEFRADSEEIAELNMMDADNCNWGVKLLPFLQVKV